MKKATLLLTTLILLLLINVQVPLVEVNIGLADQAVAGAGIFKPNDKEAQGVSEPSLLLLVGAGIAGVVAYRKIKNRNKKEL